MAKVKNISYPKELEVGLDSVFDELLVVESLVEILQLAVDQDERAGSEHVVNQLRVMRERLVRSYGTIDELRTAVLRVGEPDRAS